MQLTLTTPLLRWVLNRASPERFHIQYQSAWSIWPGTVHVKGLRLRAQDHNLQWSLEADKIDATISLVDLLRRKFHPTRVRGTGLAFRLRRKIFRPEVTAERVYGLPQIDGFDPVPLKTEEPQDVVPDARYHLWAIQLDDVLAARVREIWIDRARFTGDAQASGGFFIKPMRRVQVEAQLIANGLALRLGEDTALEDLHGQIACTVHPFDPRLTPGVLKLREISARIRVHGEITGLEFAQRLLPDDTKVEGGRGPLRMDLTFDRGTFAHGTLEATLARLRVASRKVRGSGDARFSLRGERDLEVPMTHATLELTSLSVGPRTGPVAPARARRALVAVGTEPIDLLGLPHLRTLGLDIEGGEVADLKLARAFLPAKADAHLDGGRALLEAHLEGTARETHGHAEFTLEQALVTGGGLRVRASARGELKLNGRGPLSPLQLAGGRVRVHHVDVLQGDTSSGPGWWGDFLLTSGQLDLGASSLALQMDARCRDARPIVGLFTASGKVPKIAGALFHMDQLHLEGGLRLAPGLLQLERLHAEGGKSLVRANYEKRGDEKHGEALLKFHALTVGLDLHQEGLSVVLIKPGSWYNDRVKQEELIKRVRVAKAQPAARSARKGKRF